MLSCLPAYRHLRMICLLLITAVACAGCGLGEYEELLRKNRNFAKGGDEDRKLLGDPLDLPPIKEGETSAPMLTEANVFLRPPKSFKCNPAPTLVAWDTFAPQVAMGGKALQLPGKDKGQRRTELYVYKGSEGCNILLAAVTSDYFELDDSERAAEATEFKRTVWSAFAYDLQQHQGRLPKDAALPTEPKQKKQEEVTPPRVGKVVPVPLKFDVWLWEDPEPQAKGNAQIEAAKYSLYFHQNAMNYVAVIYQIPRSRANDAALQKSIEASLKSLAIGVEGALKRYNSSKGK
jgi:hypothetical protein